MLARLIYCTIYQITHPSTQMSTNSFKCLEMSTIRQTLFWRHGFKNLSNSWKMKLLLGIRRVPNMPKIAQGDLGILPRLGNIV
jgi:hypothetical protein